MLGLVTIGTDLAELAFDSAPAPGLPFVAQQRLARYTLELNPRLGLTGELRLESGRFSFAVEGAAEVVLPLAARIFADQRHAAISLGAFGPLARRRFDAWRVVGFDLDGALPAAAVAANLKLVGGAGFGPRRPLAALSV